MIIHSVDSALTALKSGDVVAIPTETVYGLAGSVENPEALKKIFFVKERPLFDPLIVHVDGIEMAKRYTLGWSAAAEALARKFWPGPLTLVLPKSAQVPAIVTSGLESVGLRVPNQSMTLELIKRLKVGLAAPSANKFGKTSPTRAEHVEKEFHRDGILVLDGGACQVGVESTVLKIDGAKHFLISILRSGDIGREQISECLIDAKLTFDWHHVEKKYSPGQMKHHYMPDIPLVLVDFMASEDEILAAAQQQFHFLPEEVEGVRLRKPSNLRSLAVLQLPEDPKLAARELYAQLRVCAGSEKDLIAFPWPKDFDLEKWEAVRDRLMKAASLDLRES